MRKKKLPFTAILNFSTGYYDFGRATYNGRRGTFYRFDRLTDADRATVARYNNTAILNGRHRYAPEIQCATLFVADKCF